MGDKRFVEICKKGTLEEVREALANGADVNERCEVFKGTSLINAVYDGNEPLVSLLLQQPGIQVNAQDGYNYTALHHAAFKRGDKGKKVIRLFDDLTVIQPAKYVSFDSEDETFGPRKDTFSTKELIF